MQSFLLLLWKVAVESLSVVLMGTLLLVLQILKLLTRYLT